MYKIYYIISEDKTKTYTGFTYDLKKRIKAHRNKKVKTTKKFGNFNAYLIDRADNIQEARNKERYWKSESGRKKLKSIFNKIINGPFV